MLRDNVFQLIGGRRDDSHTCVGLVELCRGHVTVIAPQRRTSAALTQPPQR
ncbi:hypothetical protein I546_2508 [Mycobacterium kansasii 732]|nr:hypothetical protein I546_2508 [Mycobacterium kansasii 732]